MTVWGALFGVGTVFFAGLAILAGGKVWRGEGHLDPDFPEPWWILGDETWRGFVRAAALMWPFGAVVFGLFCVQELVGADTGAGRTVLVVATLSVLLALLIVGSITLFNRPSFLVPPQWRRDAGLLDRRRRTTARAARRRRPR